MLLTSSAHAQSEIAILSYAGPINSASSEYITRGIQNAEGDHASAVLIELDTPGGLDSSMREIVQDEMNAPIPVIVFVAPRGGRAASAGCLIVLGADVAAMAPGTNIGAAHPVYSTGGEVSQKIVNDAAAYARSLAAAHGRNAAWAERAVSEGISATAQEAVSLRVVDLMANDVPTLISQLNGQIVHLPRGDSVLALGGAQLVTIDMNTHERLIAALSDPTIAYLLLLLGALAIMVEFVAPHGFITGSIGFVAVLIALVGLTNLPVQVSGAALLILSIVLLGLELKITSHGFLMAVGLGAFIGGSILFLPRIPGYRISPLAIGFVTLIWALVLTGVVRLVVRARHQPVLTGTHRITGLTGVAKTDLAPRGVVLVQGEDWNAMADTSPITRGEAITVLSVEGLTVRVRRTA